MGKTLRCRHFDRLNAPVVEALRSGLIVYHNKAAGSVSRYIRRGCSLLSFFACGKNEAENCAAARRPALTRLCFPDGTALSVLLIPFEGRKDTRVLIVMAPMLEGAF